MNRDMEEALLSYFKLRQRVVALVSPLMQGGEKILAWKVVHNLLVEGGYELRVDLVDQTGQVTCREVNLPLVRAYE